MALSGPQQKFAEGIATGLNQTAAYLEAYPDSGEESARRSASALMTNPDVASKLEELRKAADDVTLLTIREKREFLARVVRAKLSKLSDDSDLWQEISTTEGGVKRKMPDKLKAIAQDNDLAGDGAEAGAALSVADALKAITHGAKP